jgi:predicted RNA-binding Zn-ribbon protein involved in translation (DUF1610 family)
MPILHPFLASVIAIATATCLLFIILHNRAIAIHCPHCGKYIETNTPWICGNKECGYQNNRVDVFPFIYRCERCSNYPKAYQCHHTGCGKLIFFTKDEQQSGYARGANVPAPEKPKPVKDTYETEVAKEKAEIEVIRLKVEKAKLSVELKDHEKALAPKKSIEEIYRGIVKNEMDARRVKAYIDVEFKDDETERMRQYRIVDAIMRSLL